MNNLVLEMMINDLDFDGPVPFSMSMKTNFVCLDAENFPAGEMNKASSVRFYVRDETVPDCEKMEVIASLDYGAALDWKDDELRLALPPSETHEDWMKLASDNRMVRVSDIRISGLRQPMPSSVEAMIPVSAISEVLAHWNV